MGLVAGISVFSIIELALTAFQLVKTIRCKSEIHPERKPRIKKKKEFLINSNSLFYKFGKSLSEFLKETGIHGVPYMIDKESSFTKRIFWTSALIVSMIICLMVISNRVQHLQTNVVEIKMDEKIWNANEVSLCFKKSFESFWVYRKISYDKKYCINFRIFFLTWEVFCEIFSKRSKRFITLVFGFFWHEMFFGRIFILWKIQKIFQKDNF